MLRIVAGSMKQTDAMIAHYIRAYGLHAIFVARIGKRAVVGATSNPKAALARLKRQHGRAVKIAMMWWCASRETAEYLASHADVHLAEDAAALIDAAACDAGIGLASADVVQARASAAVEAVKLELAGMKARGDLRALNAAYKAQRLQRSAAGLPMMPYPTFLQRQLIRMLYAMAETAKARAR